MRCCLDSWAVLAWLDGEEPAGELVDEALDSGQPLISWINLVEVEYQLRRLHGFDEAATVIGELRELVIEELPGVARMREVAAIKAEHPIALADCFAVATAAAGGADLITGNPEILDRRAELPCAVVDARATRRGGRSGA